MGIPKISHLSDNLGSVYKQHCPRNPIVFISQMYAFTCDTFFEQYRFFINILKHAPDQTIRYLIPMVVFQYPAYMFSNIENESI